MQVNDCLFNSQLFFAVRNGTLRNLNLNPPKDSKLVPDQAMTDSSQYMFGTGERLHETRTLRMLTQSTGCSLFVYLDTYY